MLIEGFDDEYDDDKEDGVFGMEDKVRVVNRNRNKDIRYLAIKLLVKAKKANGSEHGLCIGEEYVREHSAPPNGASYAVLNKMSAVSVCLVNEIKYRVHIVPNFDDMAVTFSSYLLNHDISRRCWSDADPVLPV